MNIKLYKGRIPSIDTAQMIEVDRLMTEEYGIKLIQMMENAGRCLAILARDRFLEEDPLEKRIIVLAGAGGNGGGALVAARRLHNWGAKVAVYLSAGIEKMKPVTQKQLQALQHIGLDIRSGEELTARDNPDLILDGLIGYHLTGDPQGLAKTMIEWANERRAPLLSLDTPSGLDLTSGQIHEPTIKANATLTLALPKRGLYRESALAYRGELYLGDISVPNELYANGLSIEVDPIFSISDILRID